MSGVKYYRARGFTLIELLIVIAIIAILGAITFSALPTVITKAKVTQMRAQFTSIRTALAAYYTDNQSYPPSYGYKKFTENAWNDTNADFNNYYLNPFFQTMKQYDTASYLDVFSEGYDTSRQKDGVLSLFDFCPVGLKVPPDGLILPDHLYKFGQANEPDVMDDIARQLSTPQRPVIYVAVNLEQFAKVENFYYKGGQGTLAERMFARIWGDPGSRVGDMQYPPPRYDAYVLISVGPKMGTFGVICDPLGTEAAHDVYHISGLRTYFLATRDANLDNFLDNDYTDRQRSALVYLNIDPGRTAALQQLPDGSTDYGPMIYKSGS